MQKVVRIHLQGMAVRDVRVSGRPHKARHDFPYAPLLNSPDKGDKSVRSVFQSGGG